MTKKTINFPFLVAAGDYHEFDSMSELLSGLFRTEVKYEEIASYDFCFPDAIGNGTYYAVMYLKGCPYATTMIHDLNAEVEADEARRSR